MITLFNARCPQCGSADQIDIESVVWVSLGPAGPGADAFGSRAHRFTADSNAFCASCGFEGILADFGRDGGAS